VPKCNIPDYFETQVLFRNPGPMRESKQRVIRVKAPGSAIDQMLPRFTAKPAEAREPNAWMRDMPLREAGSIAQQDGTLDDESKSAVPQALE
jgi:hypothetical protein